MKEAVIMTREEYKWKVMYVCDGCTNEEVLTTEELLQKCLELKDHDNPYLKEIVVIPV